MRYRVAYRKRFDQKGEGSDAPESFLNLADGVVVNAEFVESFEPDNLHGEEEMDEDDDFLPFGSEVWEYDVTPGREEEFTSAVEASGKALEMDRVEEVEDMPALEGQAVSGSGHSV